MSKIIYYIGAGASCGPNTPKTSLNNTSGGHDELIISEGLPMVSEIPTRLLSFKKYVESIEINENEYTFKHAFRESAENVKGAQARLVRNIVSLYNNVIQHATIDTYAKKLYLNKRGRELDELEATLSAFFVWEQLDHKCDQRYDTFLASVLAENTLQLPVNISFISWNYDSQFELAYTAYSRNRLNVCEKGHIDESDLNLLEGKIFKVNGTASFSSVTTPLDIMADKEVPQGVQLLIYYETSLCGNPWGITPHLSFAWEEGSETLKLMELVKKEVSDTEIVVVIGYSFPFFNRNVDRAIFGAMPNLKTLYIQDPYADAVEQSLLAVLPPSATLKIEKRLNCNQFYLPREL